MLNIIDITPVADNPSGEVLLDFDQRTKRRAVLITQCGQSLLLDLDRPAYLKDGAGLLLADGRCFRVTAVAEDLAALHTHDQASSLRLAWHLGNRHLPTQLVVNASGAAEIRIRRDHVIEKMASGLGAEVALVQAPFDPIGGAYSGDKSGDKTANGHDHDHH